MLNFWKEKDSWAPTWDNGNSMLRVKSIKYTTKINIDQLKGHSKYMYYSLITINNKTNNT